jgi:hypothetical protein
VRSSWKDPALEYQETRIDSRLTSNVRVTKSRIDVVFRTGAAVRVVQSSGQVFCPPRLRNARSTGRLAWTPRPTTASGVPVLRATPNRNRHSTRSEGRRRRVGPPSWRLRCGFQDSGCADGTFAVLRTSASHRGVAKRARLTQPSRGDRRD